MTSGECWDEIQVAEEHANVLSTKVKFLPEDFTETVYQFMKVGISVAADQGEESLEKLMSPEEAQKFGYYIDQPDFFPWYESEKDKEVLFDHFAKLNDYEARRKQQVEREEEIRQKLLADQEREKV